MRNIVMSSLVIFILTSSAQSQNAEKPAEQRTYALEGELKVHPKFLYHYYLIVGPNQVCALYGPEHDREPEMLSRFKQGSRIHVEGTLGTYHHPVSTNENLSPFPPTWVIYMDVQTAHPLKGKDQTR